MCWVRRRGLSIGCGDRVQVDGTRICAGAITENPLLRVRGENRSLPHDLRGLPEFFVIHKEERTVLAIEKSGNTNRAAESSPKLME